MIVTCAESGFTNARLCPACDTSLPDGDDIVCTSLNPSQSFKSTILAGMHPHTINDIAGRALGFWTYQVTQEAAFQQMILTDAQERASVMEKRLDTLLREANSELAGLREKIQGLQAELARTVKKNQDLAETNRKAAQDYVKLKGQLDKMVGKTMAATASMNFGKAAYGQAGGGHEPAPQTHAGTHHIGMTPMRAFQPGPAIGSKRQNTDHAQLRPVNVVNSAVPLPRNTHRGQTSSLNRQSFALDGGSVLHQSRPSTHRLNTLNADNVYRQPNIDGASRSGSSADNTGHFRMPVNANAGSRVASQMRRTLNIPRA